MTRNPRPTGRDLARMDDRSFERWIRAQFRPSWRERLAPVFELLTILWVIGAVLFVAFFATWTGE